MRIYSGRSVGRWVKVAGQHSVEFGWEEANAILVVGQEEAGREAIPVLANAYIVGGVWLDGRVRGMMEGVEIDEHFEWTVVVELQRGDLGQTEQCGDDHDNG